MAKQPPGITAMPVLIPDAHAAKFLTLGYDQLLADIWWLSFIQYYGDIPARRRDHCRLAYSYLDLVTTLDPQFIQPYWFAAFAVGGDARQAELADKIIQRGLAARQDSWYLPFIAGINQFLFAGDALAAAKYYRLSAKYAGAPVWLNRQADILQSGLPVLLKEIKTWSLIDNSTSEPAVKSNARFKLVSLWLEVYEHVPSHAAKVRAQAELNALGFRIQDNGKN